MYQEKDDHLKFADLILALPEIAEALEQMRDGSRDTITPYGYITPEGIEWVIEPDENGRLHRSIKVRPEQEPT